MPLEVRCIVDGCDAVCEGETEADVLLRAEQHIANVHPDVPVNDETMGAVRDNVQFG